MFDPDVHPSYVSDGYFHYKVRRNSCLTLDRIGASVDHFAPCMYQRGYSRASPNWDKVKENESYFLLVLVYVGNLITLNQ